MIQKDKWNEITWKRAVDLPVLNKDGKLAIFYEGIDPADVRQGILGDCWFLSSVSALAEKPDRIKKLFMNDHLEPNDVGIYGIRVCKNGEWIDIVVDDWIPVRNDIPVFSKANGHELWVILLEKAWAKLHGTYQRIETGLSLTALRDMTGAPSYLIKIEKMNKEELWRKIKEADDKDYVMSVASQPAWDVEKMQIKEKGVSTFHSYSLIDVFEVPISPDKQERLLKIRNPWGNFEWKGDWSDSSKLWNSELKAMLKHKEADDGVFYMNFKDFCSIYSTLEICEVVDEFRYVSAKVVDHGWTLMKTMV
jgi:calpain-15